MKAYQVVENGKPLEQREIETPEPQRQRSSSKDCCMWSVSFRCTYS